MTLTEFTNRASPRGLVPETSCSLAPLIQKLTDLLAAERISYCHWKSNDALERTASGLNDLDLLISRADAHRFTKILSQLGFRQAKAPADKQMPGVVDYYGYDDEAQRLVHVHGHFQLILGHDMTKNYRLPIEKPYLESAVQCGSFKVPAPEFEFIVFVIRMMLKHSTWDAILGRQGMLKASEQQELAGFQGRIDADRLYDMLRRHFPCIDAELFDRCVEALRPRCPVWDRIGTGRRLEKSLQVNARRRRLVDAYLKMWRRAVLAVRRRILGSLPKYQLQSGGAIIAIVGGDGAGKSTAVNGLHAWLSNNFDTTTVHMGKPAWSPITVTVRGILKIGNFLGLYPLETSFQETLREQSLVSPGYPWLLREVCRARDRYSCYRKARRFATNGGLVICDRFPVPQIRLMDGPLAGQFVSHLAHGRQAEGFMRPRQNSRIARALVRLEESYYRQIALPELLIVLSVDPEIAVQRKPDEDGAAVRARATEIRELNWQHTDAHIIDVSQSKSEVLTELKALIWSAL